MEISVIFVDTSTKPQKGQRWESDRSPYVEVKMRGNTNMIETMYEAIKKLDYSQE